MIALCFAAVSLIGILSLLMIWSVTCAPEGYEDASGFNYGPELPTKPPVETVPQAPTFKIAH